MSEAQIIAVIAGVIIGIITAIIGFIFIKKKTQNGHKVSSSKGQGQFPDETIWEMKSELKRLQAEVDEINRINALRKKKGGSTICSGYDYQTACDELEFKDYDLLNEWNTAGDYGDAEDASEYQQKLSDIDKKLDSDDKLKINEALEDLKDLCYNNPEDVELLYRIGKVHVKLSEEQSEDVVKQHVEKGIKALTTALNLNKKHAEVHKWYAILLGLRAQFQPMQQKARDGMLLKVHCDLACSLKPDDPVLHHILGRFDFEIASLGWFEKKIAAAFMGDTLDSSYTDALNRFMTAERLAHQKHLSAKEKIENKKMIANTLVAMDRKAEAEKWFKQAEHLELVVAKKAICEK